MKELTNILLSHGSGGAHSHSLIENVLLPRFSNPFLSPLGDAAELELDSAKLLFTTDGFVVHPLFFPGGDIGKLAICGTVNDLAVMGGIPLFLSSAFVLEEGLPMEEFTAVLDSMKAAAEQAGVSIVTGDTKVVERGSADRIFITTSGIGKRHRSAPSGKIEAGDRVLINGSLGDHGMAVLAVREGLELGGTPPASDCAPLNRMITALLDRDLKIRFMRDPTRGGLATVANEVVRSAGFGITLEEDAIPVKEEVKAVCELLGFDPLYVANEGKVMLIISEDDAETALELMRTFPEGSEARCIGEVTADNPGRVVLSTVIGGRRIIDMLTGDQLPRIC